MSKNEIKNIQPQHKVVLQISLNGTVIKKWASIGEAQRQTKIFKGNIISACKIRYRTAGGFIWRYADKDGNPTIPVVPVATRSRMAA